MTIVRTARRPDTSRARRLLAAGTAGLLAAALLASCSTEGAPDPGDRNTAGAASSAGADEVAPVSVRANVQRNGQSVSVGTRVRLEAENGTFERVTLRSGKQVVGGSTGEEDAVWKASGRLEPGQRYTVRATTVDGAGETAPYRLRFRTADLSLDQQTFPSIAPLDGETVGVGMPVIVSFDIPVRKKKAIERNLTVSSSPQQAGSWHWISDSLVRWRPKNYWRPGTDVTVKANVNSVPAGNGVFGQENRSVSFTVGEKVVHRVDVAGYTMKTFIGGQLARTTPISGGKPGFETRSGTKVIMEKHREKTMDAATTGISEDDPEYYDIEDVPYALRVTHSGEFLHGAPWSVGSQGSANVSHGCVGMSVDNARWVYENTKRGDVVEVTGTDRQMTVENGYGDWNVPFREYKQGSALS